MTAGAPHAEPKSRRLSVMRCPNPRASASVIATKDLEVAKALQSVMRRGLFRIYTNHDVIGCELGGALKNVVAIATGIAQGLGVGDNTRAAVVCRGLAEVTRL